MLGNAQFSSIKPKEIQTIKQSVLLVELEQEDSKTLRNLAGNKEQLEHYKAQVAGKNFALKNTVEKYWNLTDSMIFLTPEEIKTLTRDEDNYIVLKFGKYLDYERISTGIGANGQPAGWQTHRTPNGPAFDYNPSTKQTSLSNEISLINLSGYGGSRASIDIYLPNLYPSVSDMIYAMKQLQYTIGFYEDNPKASLSKFLKHIKRNNNPL